MLNYNKSNLTWVSPLEALMPPLPTVPAPEMTAMTIFQLETRRRESFVNPTSLRLHRSDLELHPVDQVTMTTHPSTYQV